MATRGGRKICTCSLHRGPRWRLLLDFEVKVWGDSSFTWVAQYQSWCKTCYNMYSRRRKAVLQGRDPDATGPHGGAMSREQKRRNKAAEYQRRMARKIWNPELGVWETGRQKLNRTQREAAAGRRREAGVPERGPWARYRSLLESEKVRDQKQMVSFTPLVLWLWESGLARQDSGYQASKRKNGTFIGVGLGHGKEAPWDDEIRRRLREAGERGTISVAVVDRVLMAVGRPDMMAVLYPVSGEEAVG